MYQPVNADVQNESIFFMNKKALQVHCSAELFSGYSTGKSNKTPQQRFKLIVSLLNVIYFCQSWSFTFCTASLRVALVLKTLLKQNMIVFQQGLYLSVWKAEFHCCSLHTQLLHMKHTSYNIILSYHLLWVKLQVVPFVFCLALLQKTSIRTCVFPSDTNMEKCLQLRQLNLAQNIALKV